MYFQIENTPEHIRRARRSEAARQKVVPVEETPRLVIAPFSRPPQVVFENVVIGTTAERNLEVFNPTNNAQQITLGKAPPAGLVVQLPGEWLELDPQTCYTISMLWAPTQPTALRETLSFTNGSRGRYDVVVVLKSAMSVQPKNKQPKSFKISPGKIKKKSNSKRSPVSIYKKKCEIVYNQTAKIKQTMNMHTTVQQKVYTASNKENVPSVNNYLSEQFVDTCPFDTHNSINFDTSEIFSNMKQTKYGDILQETFDKDITKHSGHYPPNVLKPSNKHTENCTALDAIDDLTFTPLKVAPTKKDKLEKGPNIVLTMNSECSFDDSLDMKFGEEENQPHSIMCIASAPANNKWLAIHQLGHLDQNIETPSLASKKIPNTSSPKELNSPNFSINTEFSRISDLSFFPPRFSTERKVIPKPMNDTHDIIDDHLNSRMHSDTYTKESPIIGANPSMDRHMHHAHAQQQNKVCRQSLFKDFHPQRDQVDRNRAPYFETNAWQNELRVDIKSPPRSLSPPLQSIPEESGHFSETQILNKTDKQNTFTINRTFDKFERPSLCSKRESWSKKSARAEPELWKIPVSCAKKSTKQGKVMKRDSISTKISNVTFDSSRSMKQNVSLNQISNVYSQSLTVDPFMSSTYFYDEEAVDKFEHEFKRWLNYILTPPADLDSNIEQKIDLGKAWIENRNKEVPLAPTKEQVCSAYHNSHRLVSLRRAAKTLLMSPEISLVIQKVNAQIEKKLIAIRNDRNLHLDVGLQKIIMEIILSYNPLWLRIGLEAIYGLVIPLKSNSDIEGLTVFIIQRMFKNPHLKNKHSKSNAPNMLLPAYMEAIKKFTLKKFFMLVFFLDQAKQKKLISHDPCLFCRNALCKESREVIIKFTRELIAGIGDITKHLRPLGYVVSIKQSYLDEYKYAVHNIAVDIRDGVRITKVMEIILMKNSLMNQLRTPAISRLQKIHNVQVALNALKEANFVIVGEITANDIADGHREKTLSLLWQIIHVFRAPLFDKAANVIQMWWKKKYEVIAAKRKEEEAILSTRNNAASAIQCWWRRIQYNKYVEIKMKRVVSATVTIQKYFRMWLCRTHLMKLKYSVRKIEDWYRALILSRQAKKMLAELKIQREIRRNEAATKIQVYVRRWMCMRQYEITVKRIILIQSLVRCYLLRKKFLELKEAAIKMQRRYRGKLAMKELMNEFEKARLSAIKIQSYYKMVIQMRILRKLKIAVRSIEEKYIALNLMRQEQERFQNLRKATILAQSLFRQKKCRDEYLKCRNTIVKLQNRVRANLNMKKERKIYLEKKEAALVLQSRIRAYLQMTHEKQTYIQLRSSAISIQRYFRSYQKAKIQRESYIAQRNAALVMQRRFRALIEMRKQRSNYFTLKMAVITIQNRYRAQKLMQRTRTQYLNLHKSCVTIQRRYRARILMEMYKAKYMKMKNAAVVIQRAYMAHYLGRKQRLDFLIKKNAVLDIQRWYRSCKKAKEVSSEYQHTKQACVLIQRTFRAYVIGTNQRKEYLRIKTATISIQKYYRSYVEMKIIRQQFIQLKTAAVRIQKTYRAVLEGRKVRDSYLKKRNAVLKIQDYYRRYRITQSTKLTYTQNRKSVILIQRYFRSVIQMRKERAQYLKLKKATIVLQERYRALITMRVQRELYQRIRSSVITIQTRFRALILMRNHRRDYLQLLAASQTIQRYYKARLAAKLGRGNYIKLRSAAITIQSRYRALVLMRKVREDYLRTISAVVAVQNRYRARRAMIEQRNNYKTQLNACCRIQRWYRAHTEGKKQRDEYLTFKAAATVIQQRYRLMLQTRQVRAHYLRTRNAIVKIQQWYRSLPNQYRVDFLRMRKSAVVIQSTFRMFRQRNVYLTQKSAATYIQKLYRSHKLTVQCRNEYVHIRSATIKLQSFVRSFIQRSRYVKLRATVLTLQAVYRLKKHRREQQRQRETFAICIQKHFRRYVIQSRYIKYRESVIVLQRAWRTKLLTRLLRCDFEQKRRLIVRVQANIRGMLARRAFRAKRAELERARQEKIMHRAASKIQALFRGHMARVRVSADRRVAALRRRWRAGALRSTQETLHERNAEAMEVLSNMYDIETVIRAFRSLELLTEVFPMMYNANASAIVHRVYIYMSVTNRSISSIEVLKSASSVLVNLARYKVTGPKIYNRERIAPVLKFMWRFSNSETELFCILCTYLWLFSKYDTVREDLASYLKEADNHKMLSSIKGNVDRMKRMAERSVRGRTATPQASKFVSLTPRNLNVSLTLPAVEPDYGITRADKPQYFEDAFQAITCLFRTYNL